MKKPDLVSGIILMILSLIMLLEARKLDFGSLNSPKEGLLPFILAILLLILSSVLVGKSLRKKPEGESSEKKPEGWNLKRIGTVAGLLGLAFFFERLGYILSTFAFLVFLLWVIERQRWWVVFTVAFLSTLVSYLILGPLLDSPLPKGILGW
jgi:putative tricarboxylic transport membrane protein